MRHRAIDEIAVTIIGNRINIIEFFQAINTPASPFMLQIRTYGGRKLTLNILQTLFSVTRDAEFLYVAH